MLGKISPTDYERCYPTRMKRYFRRNINYLPKTYDEIIPNVKNQIVGNIPPEIIQLFGEHKKEKIKDFKKALSFLACYIRATRLQMKSDTVTSFNNYYSPEKIAIYEQHLTEIINEKIGSIFNNDIKAEIKRVDNGGFAELFRFSLKDKDGNKIMHDKALKVFYNIVEPLEINKSFHNNFAEANFWTYIKHVAGHKLDKTQFTRHYISDMKHGYYMTEFIDNEITKTSSPLDYIRLGIKFEDRAHNQPIDDKDFYDGGGFKKTQMFIDDLVVLRYFKKIVNRNTLKEQLEVLEDQEKLIENPKTPHRDKIRKANELYKKYRKAQTSSNKPFGFHKFWKLLKNFSTYFQRKQYKLIDYFSSSRK